MKNFPQYDWLSLSSIFRKKILCYVEYKYDNNIYGNICAKISRLQKCIKMH